MPAGPGILISPVSQGGTIPFGDIAQGNLMVLNVYITNTGGANLVISNITLTPLTGNSGDFSLAANSYPVSIAPGATNRILINIAFTPTSPFETLESAQLTVSSNTISGTSSYVVTGTCRQLGTNNNFNGTGYSVSATATQNAPGSNTQTSGSGSWASQAIAAGASISVSVAATSSSSIGGGGSIGIAFQYSINSGPWATFASSAATWGGTQNFGFVPVGATNLSQIAIRVQVTAAEASPGQTTTVTVNLTGAVASIVTGGDNFLQINAYDGTYNIPAVISFGVVTLGVPVLGAQLRMYNPTPGGIAISIAPDTGSGFVITSPSSPLPFTIPAGQTFLFVPQLTAVAGGNQDDPVSFVVTLTASAITYNLESYWNAPLFIAAFILVGDVESTSLALTGASSKLWNFDSTLACEDSITFSRQYYVDQPYLNKILNRIWLFYERFGVFTLSVAASVVNPKNTPSSSASFAAPSTSDGLNAVGVLDVQITGSCIQLSFSLPANSGILSLIGFVLMLDEIGEIIENT